MDATEPIHSVAEAQTALVLKAHEHRKRADAIRRNPKPTVDEVVRELVEHLSADVYEQAASHLHYDGKQQPNTRTE